MSAELILIASYPKSGNTWTRLVFEHLLNGKIDPSINELNGAFHGRGRRIMFDAHSPVSSSDLTFDEIENCLPDMFRALVAERTGALIVKTHECSHRNRRGEWLFPPECVRAAICLVRHPFDVAVSYANHLGRTVDETIEIMAQGDVIEAQDPRGLALPLPHWDGSWSGNIESWLDRAPYNKAFARYEDLHVRPESEFGRLAQAAGVPSDPGLIATAVAAGKFERLQQEEQAKGFRERPKTSSVFFRAGKPKTWEGILDEEARAQITRDHGAMMTRLGYLEDGSTSPEPPTEFTN